MEADEQLLSSYDYELPDRYIARYPAERGSARMLVVPSTGPCVHERVASLPELLRPSDLLVVNDSRVIPARLHAEKPTGGQVELLLVEPTSDGRWTAMAKGSRRLRPGMPLRVCQGGPVLTVESVNDRGFVVLHIPGSGLELARQYGELPLPPYLSRRAEALDHERYQTIYALSEGSVAAPTAGLHFTPELLARLTDRGVELATVTLHVGPGTFIPVDAECLDDHRMHEERFHISDADAQRIVSAKWSGRRIIAVGTTTTRVLESFGAELHAGPGRTRLFIRPGHRFTWVDVLFTNFHLPRSTLLVLVSAFSGRERILNAYEAAKEVGYRFFSYGDACLLERGS
ncbi:MAG: tRNA preQ1(34) S-adenosylmethionine ribosyltransferase-isomerase QueA [Myxococcota bacterium]